MCRTFVAFAAVAFAALRASAQTPPPTPAELLQKGIFAQETAGNLDQAIQMYRQIVDSHPAQREIAAQAQYRLGQALLEKGDANAAAQEIQRLAWDFPDYKDLMDAAKKSAQAAATPRAQGVYKPGGGTFTATGPQHTITFTGHDAEFDFSRTATVTGTVLDVLLVNPYSWLILNTTSVSGALQSEPQVRISLASPADLAKVGWTKVPFTAGANVIVTGAPARDGSAILQATSVSVNGNVVFSRPAVAAQ